jgi:DNA-binding response OmpR family regulator
VCIQYGHDVHTVANGQEAWDAWQEGRHRIVILDWIMPVIDGLEVCRRIRAADPELDTYILIVTGRDTDVDVSAALAAGADDYIAKPVSPEQLRTRLQIAEGRLAERDDRRRSTAQLAHTGWVTGIQETTLALSHEINNPLQALMGEAQFLTEDATLGEDQRRQAVVILAQGNRIAAAVKRLSQQPTPRTIELIPGLRMLDLS